ncbi:MAG: PorT family protein [Muribaculaceae bacterium]|nr:PorT family protein [Muribaculaceae bacterium]
MTRPNKALAYIIAALCLMLPSAAMAQREYSPNFAIGAKAGATLSRMEFSPSVHQKMVQGYTMGITARYTEEKIFGLIGEINITQRGWMEDFVRDEAPQFSYKRQLTYIQIPLLTHIYFGSDKIKGFFNLGPEVGYMIGEKTTANFDYMNYSDIPNFPAGYRTNEQLKMGVQNKFDYGIAGGAGVEFTIKRKHSFLLEGRYYFGLGNIFKATKRDYFSASRGTSIEITLAYMIRLR